jgi:HD-GYP domain-containing protein (c-di-GMP phosphodiesterase class II)
LKNTFNNISYFQEVPIEQMKELAGHSVEKMVLSTGVLNHIYDLRRQDEYTFHHSMNVSIICGVIGKWMNIKGDRLKDLVLAGLLHDIGKLLIAPEIINKPGRLTEEEYLAVKQHPALGYQLVQKTQGVSRDVTFGILQHHEKMDGTGYPMGVEAKRIIEFAKIIAVADIYDALTSDRVYRGGVAPFVAIEIMANEMFGKLDPQTCFTFLDNIKDSLVGNIITLSDGRDAEVIYIGPNLAARPVVFAVDGEIIDLDKRKDLRIVGVKKK